MEDFTFDVTSFVSMMYFCLVVLSFALFPLAIIVFLYGRYFGLFPDNVEKNDEEQEDILQNQERTNSQDGLSFDQKWEDTFVKLQKQCLWPPPIPPKRPWTDETVVTYNLDFKPFYQKWSQTWLWVVYSPLIIAYTTAKRILYIPLSFFQVRVIYHWYEKHYSIYVLGLPVILSIVHLLTQFLFFPIDVLYDAIQIPKKEAFWRVESNYTFSNQRKKKSDVFALSILQIPAKIRDFILEKIKYLFTFRWYGEKKIKDLYQYGKFDWEDNIEEELDVKPLPTIDVSSLPNNYSQNYYASGPAFWWTQYQSVKSGKSSILTFNADTYSLVEFYHSSIWMSMMPNKRKSSLSRILTPTNNIQSFVRAFSSLFSHYFLPLKGEFFIGGRGSTFFTNYRLFFTKRDYPQFAFTLNWVSLPLSDIETYDGNAQQLVITYREKGELKTYKRTVGNYVRNEEYKQYKEHFESEKLDKNQFQLLIKKIHVFDLIRFTAPNLFIHIHQIKLYNLPDPRYSFQEEDIVVTLCTLLFAAYLVDWLYPIFFEEVYWPSLFALGLTGEHIGVMLISILVSFVILRPIFLVQFVSEKNWEEKPHVIWYRLRDLFEILLWIRVVLFFMGYFYLR